MAITLDGTLGIELVDVTGASDVASGTTAQRPASPTTGAIRFNTDLGKVETYNGSSWVSATQVVTYTATVTGSDGTSDWSGSDPVTAVITVSGLLSTDTPVVDIDLTGATFADIPDIQADWGLVYAVSATADNQLTLYATAEPASAFSIVIQVTR